MPVRFLRSILNELRRGAIVTSQRGNEGGYQLARPAAEITVGEVFRTPRGPARRGARVAARGGQLRRRRRPTCRPLWVAVRACLREVLDEVTIADVVSGELPGPRHRTSSRSPTRGSRARPGQR